MLGGGEATGNAADHGVGGGSGDGRKLQIALPMSPVKASMTAASDFRRIGTSSATTIEVWSDEVAALGTRKALFWRSARSPSRRFGGSRSEM
jgi:hypothetical protein